MHEGHRNRMRDRVLGNENLTDCEILEILLFYAFPRINTYPLARLLIDRFRSLEGVFAADKEELKSVKGVGDKAAALIIAVGECIKRASDGGAEKIKNAGDIKRFAAARFRNKEQEFLELYFLDKNGVVTRVFTYTSDDRNKVSVTSGEIAKNIAVIQPHGIIVAHNHLNGVCSPSENDVTFTRDVMLLCRMNNVKLLDHIIYSEGNFYSFKSEGGLEEINRELNKWITNSN